MNKSKISSQDIIDLLSSKASVSKRASEEFLKVLFLTIEDALMAGEVVKIKNFGTFKLQWNAERKSVNVNTGEEILIAGYYKVAFASDALLKNLINEPFAHLEPVVLDGGDELLPVEEDQDAVPLDPFHVFEEQASEIKEIISEIQSMSVKKRLRKPSVIVPEIAVDVPYLPEKEIIPIVEEAKTTKEIVTEKVVDELLLISTPIVVSEPKVIETIPEIIPQEPVKKEIVSVEPPKQPESKPEPTKVVETTVIPEKSSKVEPSSTSIEEEYVPNPFLENVTPVRKKKIWLWVIGALLLITIVKFTLYYTCPPFTGFVNNTLDRYKEYMVVESFKNALTGSYSTIHGWFAPQSIVEKSKAPVTTVVPLDTTDVDSVSEVAPVPAAASGATKTPVKKPITKVKQSVDSLQILFDTPRVYPVFIGVERIKEGSRLTLMAQRYYGCRDFWVYIYEANRDRIKNPDHIPTGTLIHIPKVHRLLIDASNPRCIQKARELHDLYVQ